MRRSDDSAKRISKWGLNSAREGAVRYAEPMSMEKSVAFHANARGLVVPCHGLRESRVRFKWMLVS